MLYHRPLAEPRGLECPSLGGVDLDSPDPPIEEPAGDPGGDIAARKPVPVLADDDPIPSLNHLVHTERRTRRLLPELQEVPAHLFPASPGSGLARIQVFDLFVQQRHG